MNNQLKILMRQCGTGNLKKIPGIVWLCTLAITPFCQASEKLADNIEYSTPPGITLVDMVPALKLGLEDPVWTRLGDAEGNTLFIFDQDTEVGKSRCTNACAQDFPPVLALPDAKATGDWTLVQREEGTQWAYQGKLLYRFVGETRLHKVIDAIAVAEGQAGEKSDGEKPASILPDGWQVARYQPARDLATPLNIELRNIPALGSVGLVDSQGMTLYSLGTDIDESQQVCDYRCEHLWQPLLAAGMSSAVGQFTLVERHDGQQQWAWHNAPLYRYQGDQIPGDINGRETTDNIQGQVAILIRHFTPDEVKIGHDVKFGRVLATSQGLPLYMRKPFESGTTQDTIYRRGKKIGTGACDAKCQKSWIPFRAPDDAVARGYWELMVRDDGSRQWAYKGHALYTYMNDQPDNVATAHFTMDYTVGDGGYYKASDAAAMTNLHYTPTGFFWSIAMP